MIDWELRAGRWEDVLADVGCDTLITDPPYSDRTHTGHDAFDGRRFDNANAGQIEFSSWNRDVVFEFVRHWSERVRGWFVAMTDHYLVRDFEDALKEQGRYVFAPVVFLSPGMTVRLQGDGPASWAVYVIVARHRNKKAAKWGALPGGYVLPKGYSDLRSNVRVGEGIVGGKPLWIMQSLVRDYSKRGDLICDPCAGAGTTLLASVIEGRSAIGSEFNEERFNIAHRRLSKGYTPTLF